ncbi:hypothetical protein ACAM_0455 [Aeropyrum camini SY1 = JCM 12091]|uniref:Uncharacterized protein n=1 Tax=Aeropyrum camini SY1 = JCM 12091 TaxID=1198449 RepID=U3TF08_9CREN|nr:hypothetical protein ACAM_0455 [Aeropyrum camini SY1 = JCM 12091]
MSSEERFLLGEIARYALRGLGSYRIGRMLWPSLDPRTAQKRVQRLLDRWERLASLCSRRRRVVSVSVSQFETSRRRVSTGEDDTVLGLRPAPPGGLLFLPEPVLEGRVVKLGRTQLLVLAALNSLSGRARFSSIVNEYLTLAGLEPSLANRERYKNRVWQALRRLAARGLVGFEGGVYWLSGPLARSNVVVENFKGYNSLGKHITVWSKKDHGRAIPLTEALIIATLRGVERVSQIELAETRGDEPGLDRLGVSIVKMYRDKHHPHNNRWKIEATLSNPPLKPRLEDVDTWLKAWQQIKKAAKRLASD